MSFLKSQLKTTPRRWAKIQSNFNNFSLMSFVASFICKKLAINTNYKIFYCACVGKKIPKFRSDYICSDINKGSPRKAGLLQH